MMMMMEEEFQELHNLTLENKNLSSLPPYDYSHSQSSIFSAISPEISPLKRSSPVSNESGNLKRRKISLQNPILITSPPLFTYPETQSFSVDDPTRDPNIASGLTRCSHAISTSEKLETTPSPSKKMKMINNHVEDTNRQETNYCYEEQQEEEEEEEEGMRIERSGDGFVIRLKCRCKQAFRVLFSDHNLYFKPL